MPEGPRSSIGPRTDRGSVVLAALLREPPDDSLASIRDSHSQRREGEMNTLFTVIVLAFVVAVLGVVAGALFELSPFAHHADQFRDPRTGERKWQSPHLD